MPHQLPCFAIAASWRRLGRTPPAWTWTATATAPSPRRASGWATLPPLPPARTCTPCWAGGRRALLRCVGCSELWVAVAGSVWQPAPEILVRKSCSGIRGMEFQVSLAPACSSQPTAGCHARRGLPPCSGQPPDNSALLAHPPQVWYADRRGCVPRSHRPPGLCLCQV